MVSRAGFPNGLHAGYGQNAEVRSDISVSELKTRKELPLVVMRKATRKTSGVFVCVCACVSMHMHVEVQDVSLGYLSSKCVLDIQTEMLSR